MKCQYCLTRELTSADIDGFCPTCKTIYTKHRQENCKHEYLGLLYFKCSLCGEYIEESKANPLSTLTTKAEPKPDVTAVLGEVPSLQEYLIWAEDGLRTHEEIYDYFARFFAQHIPA